MKFLVDYLSSAPIPSYQNIGLHGVLTIFCAREATFSTDHGSAMRSMCIARKYTIFFSQDDRRAGSSV